MIAVIALRRSSRMPLLGLRTRHRLGPTLGWPQPTIVMLMMVQLLALVSSRPGGVGALGGLHSEGVAVTGGDGRPVCSGGAQVLVPRQVLQAVAVDQRALLGPQLVGSSQGALPLVDGPAGAVDLEAQPGVLVDQPAIAGVAGGGLVHPQLVGLDVVAVVDLLPSVDGGPVGA